jgi:hypothetical protein
MLALPPSEREDIDTRISNLNHLKTSITKEMNLFMNDFENKIDTQTGNHLVTIPE